MTRSEVNFEQRGVDANILTEHKRRQYTGLNSEQRCTKERGEGPSSQLRLGKVRPKMKKENWFYENHLSEYRRCDGVPVKNQK